MYVTVDVDRKFVPVSVNVCAPVPATAEAGDKLLRLGAGFVVVTVKFTGLDVPPPGPGLVTTTG